MTQILVQLQPDGILTYMDESQLEKHVIKVDNDVERTVVTEYRLRSDPDNPRAVHRSVDMHLKTPAVWGVGVAASF